jgi:hypothetical protein
MWPRRQLGDVGDSVISGGVSHGGSRPRRARGVDYARTAGLSLFVEPLDFAVRGGEGLVAVFKFGPELAIWAS